MRELIIIIATIAAIILSGCVIPEEKRTNRIQTYDNGIYAIQDIDSCEYVVSIVYGGTSICHKGNCKFCLIRSKK